MMISARTSRFNQRKTRCPGPIEGISIRMPRARYIIMRKNMSANRLLRRLTRNLNAETTRKGAKKPFGDRAQPLFNMKIRAMIAARPPRCDPQDHNFDFHDYDGSCTDCGMSFIAHTFTECP